jgi:hypothetical protein
MDQEKLPVDRSDHMDFRRANDPEMAPSVLERLAKHPDPLVRGAVAMNATTPLNVWSSLQDDPDQHVRESAYLRMSLGGPS